MKKWLLILTLCAACNLAVAAQKIIFLGDSLTEGYGVKAYEAYPALVEKRLQSALGADIQVVNAGVSGATSASGPSRIKWLLQQKPSWLVLALGANDGLRGLPTAELQKNLNATIAVAQQQNVKVLLLGMRLPPNYGLAYTRAFEKVFADVAKTTRVPLLPFLLENVGGIKRLNQADGIHPTPEGHIIMAQKVGDTLLALLRATK